jgi:hypothetical protein
MRGRIRRTARAERVAPRRAVRGQRKEMWVAMRLVARGEARIPVTAHRDEDIALL